MDSGREGRKNWVLGRKASLSTRTLGRKKIFNNLAKKFYQGEEQTTPQGESGKTGQDNKNR